MAVMSGQSGNEMYCLRLKSLMPGELVLGNSVYSLGFIGKMGAGLRSIVGGEVQQVTSVIHDGRAQAFQRMQREAAEKSSFGISGVTSELRSFRGNVEFITVGSGVTRADGQAQPLRFSTSANGQELFCQLDAGYTPIKFVFGNVAYSMGLGRGLIAGLKTMKRGEIKEYSNIFNQTRHLALERIVNEARQAQANSVVGIQTSVMPFQGVHEMMMTGTASRNSNLPAQHAAEPVTSDLTGEELWNLNSLGFHPLKLVLGTAVYSLGVAGGISSWFKSFSRGEVSDLTTLVYDAREHAIGLIRDEASALGADDVVGIKTHIHEMGGLIEFMAIGTAVKRMAGLKNASPALPTQAIIRDRETWFSESPDLLSLNAKPGAKKKTGEAKTKTGTAVEIGLKILEAVARG